MRRLLSGVILGIAVSVSAANGVRSGPQIGERPLPFTSNMVTGPQRGQQYCYVCQLKDEPALLVFTRAADGASGKLLRELRDAVRRYRDQRLFAWMVLLGPGGSSSETALERQAYMLAEENSSTEIPVAALGDPEGPPGYRINPAAAVTVIVFRSGKVLYNRAYTGKEWGGRAADDALRLLPSLLEPKPPAKN